MGKFAAISAIAIAIQLQCPASHQARAGLSEWFTKRVVSADGRFVLVTISDHTLDEEMNLSAFRTDAWESEEWKSAKEGEKNEIRSIRAKYSRGGMYLNDGSTTPLWTCDTQWPSGDPIVAPDGDHVIFPGDWIGDDEGYGISVATFAYRGQTIRKYYCDFIPQCVLKAILNGLRWPTCAGACFDPSAMTYVVRTNQHEEFVFDVKTGNIITTHSPFPALFSIAATVLIGITGGVGWQIYRRCLKHRSDL